MVRVRFAPSPTGEPHVGSAWTALFNWLYAHGKDGTFVLRIEDTDQTRTVPGTVEKIYAMLDWLSLEPTEGPREGGPHQPYVQSERLPQYQTAAEQLLGTGTAYRCFCTPERLAKLREEQQKRGVPPMYDRHCRSLPPEESITRATHETFVVRLAVPEGETAAEDIIRGTVRWDNATLDDSVLLKSDGFPTYHLANVVDDHAMAITHVIRAEEWLPSLPKHLILYAALGWNPPAFAHLPLILGSDRKKLSKRHGHVAALEYRKQFRPIAFINFLALMGWRPPKSDQEIFSREELIAAFDLKDVRKSGAIFDTNKLHWLNVQWIRRELPETLAEMQEMQMISTEDADRVLNNQHCRQLITERAGTYDELKKNIDAIFHPAPLDPKIITSKVENAQAAKSILMQLVSELQGAEEWETVSLHATLTKVGETAHASPAQVQWIFRLALSHVNPSPPGADLALALGREETNLRLQEAWQALS